MSSAEMDRRQSSVDNGISGVACPSTPRPEEHMNVAGGARCEAIERLKDRVYSGLSAPFR